MIHIECIYRMHPLDNRTDKNLFAKGVGLLGELYAIDNEFLKEISKLCTLRRVHHEITSELYEVTVYAILNKQTKQPSYATLLPRTRHESN